jgi:hypothetical protein
MTMPLVFAEMMSAAYPIRPAAAELLRAQGLLAELAAACRKEHVLRRRWMPPRLNRRPLKNN